MPVIGIIDGRGMNRVLDAIPANIVFVDVRQRAIDNMELVIMDPVLIGPLIAKISIYIGDLVKTVRARDVNTEVAQILQGMAMIQEAQRILEENYGSLKANDLQQKERIAELEKEIRELTKQQESVKKTAVHPQKKVESLDKPLTKEQTTVLLELAQTDSYVGIGVIAGKHGLSYAKTQAVYAEIFGLGLSYRSRNIRSDTEGRINNTGLRLLNHLGLLE